MLAENPDGCGRFCFIGVYASHLLSMACNVAERFRLGRVSVSEKLFGNFRRWCP